MSDRSGVGLVDLAVLETLGGRADRYVSHEEAGRRLGPAIPGSYQVNWDIQALDQTALVGGYGL